MTDDEARLALLLALLAQRVPMDVAIREAEEGLRFVRGPRVPTMSDVMARMQHVGGR